MRSLNVVEQVTKEYHWTLDALQSKGAGKMKLTFSMDGTVTGSQSAHGMDQCNCRMGHQCRQQVHHSAGCQNGQRWIFLISLYFGGYSSDHSLVYAGGCFLNDACDHQFDQKHRPERPIPSGLICLIRYGRWELARWVWCMVPDQRGRMFLGMDSQVSSFVF